VQVRLIEINCFCISLSNTEVLSKFDFKNNFRNMNLNVLMHVKLVCKMIDLGLNIIINVK